MIEKTDDKHLSPRAKAALNLTVEDRVRFVREPRWIGYPRAQAILRKLEDLLTHPKVHRMPNLLVVGETNNGKTMIIQQFHRRHPPRDNSRGEGIVVPALIIQAPPVPDESRFYNAILEKLFAPYKPNERVDRKQYQVIKILGQVNLGLLIIDEIHHILAGNLNKQRHFLNVIKYLGNELEVPIVGVGTRDAFNALQTDPQLSNRFEPALLPKWRMDEDFFRLLASFEHMIPLKKPSGLTEENLAMKLLSMTEGTIGELSSLLTRAAVLAIGTGEERISHKVLDQAEWVAPSERKRQVAQA